jgi:hypothetical protein
MPQFRWIIREPWQPLHSVMKWAEKPLVGYHSTRMQAFAECEIPEVRLRHQITHCLVSKHELLRLVYKALLAVQVQDLSCVA